MPTVYFEETVSVTARFLKWQLFIFYRVGLPTDASG